MQENRRDSEIDGKLDRWAASRPAAEFSSDLQRKVRDKLAASLTPVKPIPNESRLVLRFVAVFVVGAAGLAAMLSKAGLDHMTAAQIGWTAGILTAGGVLFSLSLVWQMIPGRRPGFPFSSVLALSGVAVTAEMALKFPWRTSGGFVTEGRPCAVMELTIAILAAAVFFLLAHRGALFASAKLGATLAGLAVLMALIPLQSQCMFLQAPHLLAWHGGTAALLIALGALIGSRRPVARSV